MNILVVGGGGREHSLAWKINQSPSLTSLHVAPGNPGTAEFAKNVDIAAEDCERLVQYAVNENIDLVVVGPEQALVDGIADMLAEKDIKTFGPSKAAAEIESSKAFSKKFMDDLGVPTAKYQTFTEYEVAMGYLEEQGSPIVVKASGLAAGKGAIVCQTMDEARAALKEIMLDRAFGDAGDEVIIEEFMTGPEISIHVLSDGTNYIILPPSQDHKPIGDGNTGANTGGMGTLAPLPGVTEKLMDRINSEIVEPIIKGMKELGKPYVGLLYPGLMLTEEGPKVLEFNCRFGDPETQSYMRLLKSDIVKVLDDCVTGSLDSKQLDWEDGIAVNIVLAAGGYPESYQKGTPITGVDEAEMIDGVEVFHAGTKLEGDQLVNSGGRVLGVTAIGSDLDEALSIAYEAAELIKFDGKQLRTDIGKAHDNSKLANF